MNLDIAQRMLEEGIKNAYCPYSNFPVSCLIRSAKTENYYVGANVETSHYKGLHAEEVAISRMAMNEGTLGKLEWDLVIVYSPLERITPCGNCLQVLSEFVITTQITEPEPLVMSMYLIPDKTTVFESFTFLELLPNPFTFDRNKVK